jgi:hypothetical protein
MDQIKKEQLHDDEVKRILDEMQETYQVDRVAELIKDNKIEFEFEGNQYRVRLLNAKEKDELDMIRRRRFGQLLKDKDILLEKDLIIAYQEKGINIEEIDEQIKKLNAELGTQNYKLGEALVKTPGDTILKTYKIEIVSLTYRLDELNIQRNHLLEYSLENHLQIFIAQAISYLCLDIKLEDKWIRAFKNLDTFMSQDDKLINLVGLYSMYLYYR